MSKVKVLINKKLYPALLIEKNINVSIKRKIKLKNDRIYNYKTFERRLQVFIPKSHASEVYVLIPLKREEVEEIDDEVIKIK